MEHSKYAGTTKRVAMSLAYYLSFGLPLFAAAFGAVILGLSAHIVALTNAARYYWTTLGWWNHTLDAWDTIRVELLSKPINYHDNGFIALLIAGAFCFLMNIAMGSLVFGHRYSLLKLRLADAEKYRWILPTCVGLDTAALILASIVAVYAGRTEGFDNHWSVYWFRPDNLMHVGITPDVEPNKYIYIAHNRDSSAELVVTPTRWYCNLARDWAQDASSKKRYTQYCGESRATLDMVIALAGLQACILGLHVWAWRSTKNKSPLFVSDDNEARECEQD